MSPLDWAFLPLQRYVTFSGRSPRAEYWWFWLLQCIVSLVTTIIDSLLELGESGSPVTTNGLLAFALFLPSLAVSVRRLHDVNRSGWAMLAYAVGFGMVGAVGLMLSYALGVPGVLLMVFGLLVVGIRFTLLMATEGTLGENNYGANPYGLTYGY